LDWVLKILWLVIYEILWWNKQKPLAVCRSLLKQHQKVKNWLAVQMIISIKRRIFYQILLWNWSLTSTQNRTNLIIRKTLAYPPMILPQKIQHKSSEQYHKQLFRTCILLPNVQTLDNFPSW
jgi:hypothetical protein